MAILAIIVGSLLPGDSSALHAISLLHVNDKVQHFLAYAALACFPAFTARGSAAIKAALGIIALGILMEFLQRLIPGRSCDILDALSNAGGVCCGLALGSLLQVMPFPSVTVIYRSGGRSVNRSTRVLGLGQ